MNTTCLPFQKLLHPWYSVSHVCHVATAIITVTIPEAVTHAVTSVVARTTNTHTDDARYYYAMPSMIVHDNPKTLNPKCIS